MTTPPSHDVSFDVTITLPQAHQVAELASRRNVPILWTLFGLALLQGVIGLFGGLASPWGISLFVVAALQLVLIACFGAINRWDIRRRFSERKP